MLLTVKICGILTEMSAEINMVNYVVCGIGVNVNTESFDDDIADKATSMFIESGHKYVRNELIAKLLNEFEYYYKKFLDGGLSAILDEYKKCCVTLGREVNVIFKMKQFAELPLTLTKTAHSPYKPKTVLFTSLPVKFQSEVSTVTSKIGYIMNKL